MQKFEVEGSAPQMFPPRHVEKLPEEGRWREFMSEPAQFLHPMAVVACWRHLLDAACSESR